MRAAQAQRAALLALAELRVLGALRVAAAIRAEAELTLAAVTVQSGERATTVAIRALEGQPAGRGLRALVVRSPALGEPALELQVRVAPLLRPLAEAPETRAVCGRLLVVLATTPRQVASAQWLEAAPGIPPWATPLKRLRPGAPVRLP